MKKLFLLMGMVCLVLSASASHFLGGYFSYRYLNSDKIEVSYHLTSGCWSPVLNSYAYEISYGNTSFQDSVRYASIRNVTPLGAGCPDTCGSGGTPYMLMERTFKDTLDIDTISACMIRLSLGMCCRETCLGCTSAEPGYVYTEFNKCLGTANSSPVFDKPMTYLLPTYENAVLFYDPEDIFDQRDSLSLSLLETALLAPTIAITYKNGLNAKQPLMYQGFPGTPLTYSNAGGWIRITPTQQNSYAYVAGQIYEWYDSAGTRVLASKTHFDHILITIPVSGGNLSPQLFYTGGGNGQTGNYDPCGDSVQYLDYVLADSADSLSYFIEADAPLSYSVVDTNKSYKNIRIAVSIPDSLVNDTFYVRVYAKDNQCGMARQRNFLLPFTRYPKPGPFSPPQLDSQDRCNGYLLSLSDPAQQGLSFTFSNRKDTQSVYFQQAGYHPITINVKNSQGCSVSIPDSVYLASISQVQSNITYNTLRPCPGVPSVFVANPAGGEAPYRVSWNVADTGLYFSTATTDSLNVSVETKDAHGCITRDFFQVVPGPGVSTYIQGNVYQCYDNGPLEYKAFVYSGAYPFSYDWQGLGTQDRVIIDPSGDTTIFLVTTDSLGCVDTASLSIIRYNGPVAYAGPDISVCGGRSVTLQATANPNHPATYTWKGIGNGVGITFQPDSSGYVVLEVSDTTHCHHYDSLYLTVWPEAKLDITGPDSVCENSMVSYHASASGTALYHISWGGMHNDTGADYSFTALQSVTVLGVLTDSKGCQDSQTVDLVVFPADTIVLSQKNLSLCENSPAIPLLPLVQPAYGYWSGYGVTANHFDPDSAGPGFHRLRYQIGTGQCFDMDSLLVEVRGMPQTDFEADIHYGAIPLLVHFTNLTGGSYQWHWDFGDPAVNNDTSNLMHPGYSYTNTGSFTVTLRVNDGVCLDSLSKAAYIQTWGTGVAAQENGNIRIYPNPFSSSLTLEYSGIQPEKWRLYSAAGKLLSEGSSNGLQTRIDTESLPAGFYVLVMDGYRFSLIKD